MNEKEERRKERKKERKKKNKIVNFAFNFLDCEEKSSDSGAISDIRIAKSFHV